MIDKRSYAESHYVCVDTVKQIASLPAWICATPAASMPTTVRLMHDTSIGVLEASGLLRNKGTAVHS